MDAYPEALYSAMYGSTVDWLLPIVSSDTPAVVVATLKLENGSVYTSTINFTIRPVEVGLMSDKTTVPSNETIDLEIDGVFAAGSTVEVVVDDTVLDVFELDGSPLPLIYSMQLPVTASVGQSINVTARVTSGENAEITSNLLSFQIAEPKTFTVTFSGQEPVFESLNWSDPTIVEEHGIIEISGNLSDAENDLQSLYIVHQNQILNVSSLLGNGGAFSVEVFAPMVDELTTETLSICAVDAAGNTAITSQTLTIVDDTESRRFDSCSDTLIQNT